MVAKSARFLAPIALAAVAVGIYLIVHSGLATHTPTTTPTSSQLLGGPHRHRGRRIPRFYTVQGGDTLSQISVRTKVSILRLTELNPGISPNSLQTGQRLRLRR
ncbi:MAG: LysM peptidoglycan-binding domain-containing protein [Solirubrobacteraceae bacterium]